MISNSSSKHDRKEDKIDNPLQEKILLDDIDEERPSILSNKNITV